MNRLIINSRLKLRELKHHFSSISSATSTIRRSGIETVRQRRKTLMPLLIYLAEVYGYKLVNNPGETVDFKIINKIPGKVKVQKRRTSFEIQFRKRVDEWKKNGKCRHTKYKPALQLIKTEKEVA